MIERLVEEQLKHYNNHDLEAFVQVFDDDVEVYVLGEKAPYMVGRDAMRERYGIRFQSKDLHARIIHRMIKGNTVIDHEEVTGIGEDIVYAIAIYQVGEKTIEKVWFVR